MVDNKTNDSRKVYEIIICIVILVSILIFLIFTIGWCSKTRYKKEFFYDVNYYEEFLEISPDANKYMPKISEFQNYESVTMTLNHSYSYNLIAQDIKNIGVFISYSNEEYSKTKQDFIDKLSFINKDSPATYLQRFLHDYSGNACGFEINAVYLNVFDEKINSENFANEICFSALFFGYNDQENKLCFLYNYIIEDEVEENNIYNIEIDLPRMFVFDNNYI